MTHPGVRESRSLPDLRTVIGDCQRCKLAPHRTKLVFGVGNPNADLVFVGEAPGQDEDLRGEPFVGRAGQLLTEIIVKGMKIRREDVYIANIIKCRPPQQPRSRARRDRRLRTVPQAPTRAHQAQGHRYAREVRRSVPAQDPHADQPIARRVGAIPGNPTDADVSPGLPPAQSGGQTTGMARHPAGDVGARTALVADPGLPWPSSIHQVRLKSLIRPMS